MQGDSRAWQVERDRLVGLAYRMLGSVLEAEEVVQERQPPHSRVKVDAGGRLRARGAILVTYAAAEA